MPALQTGSFNVLKQLCGASPKSLNVRLQRSVKWILRDRLFQQFEVLECGQGYIQEDPFLASEFTNPTAASAKVIVANAIAQLRRSFQPRFNLLECAGLWWFSLTIHGILGSS